MTVARSLLILLFLIIISFLIGSEGYGANLDIATFKCFYDRGKHIIVATGQLKKTVNMKREYMCYGNGKLCGRYRIHINNIFKLNDINDWILIEKYNKRIIYPLNCKKI